MEEHRLDEQETEEEEPRRFTWWHAVLWVLTTAILVSFVGHQILAYTLLQRQEVRLPVTGGMKTPTPGADSAQPTQTAGRYRDRLEAQLDACMASYHHIFYIQSPDGQTPGPQDNDAWRAQMKQVLENFHTDCGALGDLPDAPPAYADVDHWVQLAAAEVSPAMEEVNQLIESGEISGHGGLRHLLQFAEYTAKAQSALHRSRDWKVI